MSYAPAFLPTLEDETDDNLGGGLHGASIGGGMTGYFLYRRREFIALLGSAVAWPLAARAQQPAVPVIGVLGGNTPAEWRPFVAAFNDGLKEVGYVDGQNLLSEYRWAEGDYAQLPALATDLVRHKVALIAAIGGVNYALAAKAATAEIPIVFLTGRDPVELGFVDSLNRPNGNLTGVSLLNDTLTAKRFELLRELVPNAVTVGFLINPNNRNHQSHARTLEAVASGGGQRLIVVGAGSDRDFEPSFSTLSRERVEGLIVAADPFLDSQRERLVKLAIRHAVPTIFQWREFVQAGGLVSYGTSLADAHRQQGIYAGKILRGARPADLPVVQPTKFELFVNRRTAKALGIDVPTSILLRADEVIE
jgi:putative tryptophan/tyrosine transport system substrate-binding protein